MPLLKGKELLAVGTWPGNVTFTVDEDDIDNIVSSFSALNLAGRIPLKLGHEEADIRDGTRQFSLGWVKKVWRAGTKLLADLDVPTKVKDAIDEGYLKFVSVELLKNVRVHNRVLPMVLDAVALLGADQPAVGILKDLQELTLSRRTTLRAGASRVTLALNRQESTTEDEEMDEKEIQKAVAKALADAIPKAVETALEPINVKLKAAEDRADKAEKATADQALKFKREQIDALFNEAIEAKLIDPKVRESYIKLTKYDKNDVNALELKLEDVKEYIGEKTDPKKLEASKKKLDKDGKPATETGTAQDDDSKDPPDVRVLNRAKKLCASRAQDPNDHAKLHVATMEVLRDNKELAKAYQNQDKPVAQKEGA